MILPCAKCGADVPEGASSCPSCGAGLATLLYNKKQKQPLTRTLIGKAVELRNSIPWANPSAVMLLDDPRRPGKRKVRPAARNVVIAVLALGIAGETAYLLTRPEKAPVFEVVIAPPETKPLAEVKPPKPKEAAPPPLVEAPKPKEPPPPPMVQAPAPAPPKPAKPAKPANGTLVVTTRHSGKPVTGAVVRINGVNLGPTPVNSEVIPGIYTVKVEKPGFKTEKRPSVEVRAAKKQVLVVDLKK